MAVIALAACGDDDDVADDGADAKMTSRDEDLVAAFSDGLRDSGAPFTDDHATCLATAMVDIVGGADFFADQDLSVDDAANGDVLDDIGFEPTDDQAANFGDRFLDCGASMGELLGAGMAATGSVEVTDEFIDCVDGEFTRETIGRMFLGADDGGGGEDVITDAGLACAHRLDL